MLFSLHLRDACMTILLRQGGDLQRHSPLFVGGFRLLNYSDNKHMRNLILVEPTSSLHTTFLTPCAASPLMTHHNITLEGNLQGHTLKWRATDSAALFDVLLVGTGCSDTALCFHLSLVTINNSLEQSLRTFWSWPSKCDVYPVAQCGPVCTSETFSSK